MGSTALEICQRAYRKAMVGQPLTTFGTNQNEPYNFALDLLNDVINEINRQGELWFLLTKTTLTYVATNTNHVYDLGALNIDPRRIKRIARTLDQQGRVRPMNWPVFNEMYRRNALVNGTPVAYSVFNDTLEFNTSHDKDYGLVIEHYKDMPRVTATTDTLLVPERDEDVLEDGVLALLKQRIAMPDADTTYLLYQKKLDRLVYDSKRNNGNYFVRPARF